jgi:hypothetical protein
MEFSDIMLTWQDNNLGVMENILLMSATQSQEYLRNWNNKCRILLSLFTFKFLRKVLVYVFQVSEVSVKCWVLC